MKAEALRVEAEAIQKLPLPQSTFLFDTMDYLTRIMLVINLFELELLAIV